MRGFNNRQHENWLEAKESNIRGHERSLNARNGEISRLKKKVERAVQKIRDFGAKIKRKMEKKRERIARETVIIATAVRERTKETHRATLNGLEKELVELEKIHEEKQKETHEKVAGYTAEIKEKGKEIERLRSEIEGINKRIENGGPDPMYEMNTALMYEKVPNRWHNGMKEAFKKINERGYTTKEGWRIQLEI